MLIFAPWWYVNITEFVFVWQKVTLEQQRKDRTQNTLIMASEVNLLRQVLFLFIARYKDILPDYSELSKRDIRMQLYICLAGVLAFSVFCFKQVFSKPVLIAINYLHSF